MEQNKEISKNKGWEYMQELAQNGDFTEHHTLYTPVPHKILRCLNLGSTAKLILLDLVSYMGDKHFSYPSIEDIALNCNMSHVTIQANIKELENKKFLNVMKRHNNTYYLPDKLHMNPYILLSEVLHEFRRTISSTGLSHRQRNKFIKDVLRSSIYTEKLKLLLEEYKGYLKLGKLYSNLGGREKFKVIIAEFSEEVKARFKEEYPEIVL